MPQLWKQRVVWVALAALAYWVALFVLTHLPVPPGLIPPGVDKVEHFLAYLGLTLLLAAVMLRVFGFSWALLVVVWLVVASYGVVDEWSQSFVPGRTASAADWIADVTGAFAGVLLAAIFWPMYLRRRNPERQPV